MPALRAKSLQITGYLEALISERLADTLQVVTPPQPERRGCQLSLRVVGGRERGRALFEYLAAQRRARRLARARRDPHLARPALQPPCRRAAVRAHRRSVARPGLSHELIEPSSDAEEADRSPAR